ncbi:MAG TPA: hypothetical protein VME21_00345, partial [Steroidobacteraceae bacterium]|nr:hypothetical protein [Steroidobacteraceae bacterium]
MNYRVLLQSGLGVICTAALASGGGSQAAAAQAAQAVQAAQAGATAPASESAYAALAKLPDWSGVWDPAFMRPPPGTPRPAAPKLTP